MGGGGRVGAEQVSTAKVQTLQWPLQRAVQDGGEILSAPNTVRFSTYAVFL